MCRVYIGAVDRISMFLVEIKRILHKVSYFTFALWNSWWSCKFYLRRGFALNLKLCLKTCVGQRPCIIDWGRCPLLIFINFCTNLAGVFACAIYSASSRKILSWERGFVWLWSFTLKPRVCDRDFTNVEVIVSVRLLLGYEFINLKWILLVKFARKLGQFARFLSLTSVYLEFTLGLGQRKFNEFSFQSKCSISKISGQRFQI